MDIIGWLHTEENGLYFFGEFLPVGLPVISVRFQLLLNAEVGFGFVDDEDR